MEDCDVRCTVAKRKDDELNAEKRSTVLLTFAGEPGPSALRTPARASSPVRTAARTARSSPTRGSPTL